MCSTTKTNNEVQPWLTTAELARALHLDKATIYRLIKEGLPAYKVRSNYRFDLAEVKAWLRDR